MAQNRLEQFDITRLEQQGIAVSELNFAADTQLFRPGDSCQLFLFVLDGDIRVEMTTESGRDITLYRINPNHSCILTTSCLLNNERYFARGLTETKVTAIGLSREQFYKAMDVSPSFTRYVLNEYATRVSSVIKLVDRIAVRDVMLSLTRYLVEHMNAQSSVDITQTSLANEIGTAREVISRNLQKLEANGVIETGRGNIQIIDIEKLKLAAQL